MPIDPTIPALAFGRTPPQHPIIKTPTEIKTEVAIADQEGFKADEMRQDAKDRMELQRLLKETGGDTDKVIMRMMTINPKLALELKESVAKEAKATYDALLARQKQAQGVLESGSMILQGAVDEPTYQRARQQLGQLVPGLAQSLPEQYDQTTVQAAMQQGWQASELNKVRTDALEAFGKGEHRLALASQLASTRDQKERDETFDAFRKIGGQSLIAQQFDREWNPLALERDKKIAEEARATSQSTGTAPTSQDVSLIVPGKRGEVAGQFLPGRGTAGAYLIQNEKGDWVTAPVGTRKAPPPQAPLRDTSADNRLWVDRPQRDGTTKAVRVREDEVQPGDEPRDTRQQGRAVSSGDSGRISEFNTSLDDTAVLRQTVSTAGATGFRAALGAKVPDWATDIFGWGSTAKSKQAVIDRVKQVIGKALEGGVLRKEDEYKYEKILPTLRDPESVVRTKLDGLEDAILKRRDTFIDSLEDSGFDVEQHRARTTSRTQDTAKTKYRGTIEPPAVPPQVASRGRGRHPQRRDGKIVAIWVVYEDGSADKQAPPK